MAQYDNTEELLAIKLPQRYPNSWHLFEDIETACTVVKTQNGGRGDVKFTATGLDRCNMLIVKMIETGLRFFRTKKDEDEACKHIG